MEIQIESCYSGGALVPALLQAVETVQRIGEACVLHVIARQDETEAWWVDVIYDGVEDN